MPMLFAFMLIFLFCYYLLIWYFLFYWIIVWIIVCFKNIILETFKQIIVNVESLEWQIMNN